MELLLFDRRDDIRPERVIPIDSRRSTARTISPGRAHGTAYRIPPMGCVLTPLKSCWIHMAAVVAVPKNYNRDAARRQGDNAATAMKSIVADPVDV